MKSIGFACVGGGTKAASNIGAIQAFNEAGIKISAISGTSCRKHSRYDVCLRLRHW